MKQILLSICLAAGFLMASAQDIQILYHNKVVNDATITVYGDEQNDILECHLEVKNNTSADLTVFVRRVNNKVIAGTDNYFCWGLCYSPMVDTSIFTVLIPAGATCNEFVGEYSAGGIRGTSNITYEFFDNTTLANRVAANVNVNYCIAGSFALFERDTTLVNSSTLVVFSSDNQVDELEQKIKFVNNSGSDAELYVRRIINEEVNGSENSFCFGILCYSGSTDTSAIPTLIASGTVDSSFKAEYFPNQHAGKTSVTYEFFNLADGREEIRVSVTVIYNISGVGIEENEMAIERTYPNPASSSVTVEYRLKPGTASSELVLRNITGQTLSRVQLDRYAGETKLDISWLANGVYTISLIDDNKVVSNKKLVVRH